MAIAAGGGLVGYLWYYLMGCTTGCPSLLNPWVISGMGAVAGFVLMRSER